MSMCNLLTGQEIQEKLKKKTLLRTTKDMELWKTMIIKLPENTHKIVEEY